MPAMESRKANATSFKPGHKPIPNSYREGSVDYRVRGFRDERKRMKTKFIRALVEEYGPELTASQMAHVNSPLNTGRGWRLAARS
jgi:hypothetical protein